ncbi:hypothetical protein P167DRAFT_107531 [Morchella conica CCBAS932]|uniref:RBR-type E3 ubiquitin transferase n=2 Tax=Morchella sect. Distantes TaxID=1051054 RepID=A0A3N4KWL0_9PEZI|nr:hypothetical protein P167DRAFT_107531 [Morchella conica CCBAS932]
MSKKHPMSSSSSIETSSSGASSTAEANWWADNQRRASGVELFENFSGEEERNDPASANSPLEEPTESNRKGFEIPEHPPQYGSRDQVAADEALAERLANFQADFQRPSDLFDEEEDRESNSSAFMRKQYQQDRELAEMLSAGLDPDMDRETLELIKRLSGDSPQDFHSFLDQEAESEALIAELSDSHVLRDWELARQLAEDTPQDMEEHLRQLKEQEEYARLAQEAWDEDIRKREREELAVLAEMARLEELEILEQLRRERMADCTACSEEGEKAEMAMLSCSHGYCTGCIKVAFEGALREKKPFRCCDQVPIDSIAAHFTQNFVRDYNDLMLELNTPNALYCSARNCSKFIPPTSIRADTGTCRACNSNTCRHCRSPSHTGICPADEDSTVVLGLAKEKGWKPCPGCQNMIERVDGCLHMTCTRCPNRTEFCYNCGKLYSICPATCSR